MWRRLRSSQPPREPRGLSWMCVSHHSAGPPRNQRKWRQLRSSQPRKEPRGPDGVRVATDSAGPPRSPRKWRQLRSSQPPREPRGPDGIPVATDSAGPPRSPRKWRRLRSSQAPGTARPRCHLRRTSLRWPSQEPTIVATVAQLAAPREARPRLVCVRRDSAGPPRR